MCCSVHTSVSPRCKKIPRLQRKFQIASDTRRCNHQNLRFSVCGWRGKILIIVMFREHLLRTVPIFISAISLTGEVFRVWHIRWRSSGQEAESVVGRWGDGTSAKKSSMAAMLLVLILQKQKGSMGKQKIPDFRYMDQCFFIKHIKINDKS